MKKRGIMSVLLVFALILVLAMPLISASITFDNQTSTIYNLGDDFSITATISQSSTTNSFFSTKLSCPSNSNDVEIFRAPYKILSGEQKTLTIEAKLEQSLISNLKGQCIIKGEYSTDVATSNPFEITNEVIISSNVNVTEFNPGETISIDGTAIKKNNAPLEGFVHVALSELGIDIEQPVASGEFAITFDIPKNAKAKSYILGLEVYEKDEFNETTNSGSSSLTFNINQIATELEIATNLQQIKPGQELTYSISLADQSGENIPDKDITLIITKPDKSIAESKILKSGESGSFATQADSTAGIWTLDVTIENLTSQRLFAIEELASASFSLVNDTLYIQNNGNVPYRKTIDILIGENKTLKQDLDIPLAGVAQFKLSAPEGEYEIKVNTGETTESLGKAYLTGRAIDAQSLKEIAGSRYAIGFWIALILVLAWIVFRYYRKTRSPAYKGSSPASFASPIKVSSNVPSTQPTSGSSGKSTSPNAVIASSINQGDKQDCLVIALKIRNLETIKESKSNAMESISLALAKARELKASVYEQNEFRIMVIPKSTAKEELALTGAKLVKSIDSLLTEHNKKYTQKISYGIGANIGELIVERIQGKFKFSQIGNTIQTARKIAEIAKEEALISEKIRNQAMKDIKVERKGDYWTISMIKDHSAHSEFINRFMNRNKLSG
ncbi:hypothetical protein J4217_00655 [Candidatus Pacearchaeota archaeon]|nr:hypothetical protein [Candidatus Pacearchaeota archaeon]